jgi:hypothetical protein
MFLLQQFAPALAVGALVAFTAALSAKWLQPTWAKQLVFAIGAGGGYAAAHARTTGLPSFPPGDATQWLLFAGLVAIALGFAFGTGVSRLSVASTLATFGLFSIGVFLLLLTPKFRYGWSIREGTSWLTGLVVAAAIAGWSLHATLHAGARRSSLLWLLLLVAGLSAALGLSGSLMLAQLAAGLASVVFGLMVASFAGVTTERTVVPALAVIYVGLIASGYFYSELPWTSASLLALPPALILLIPGEPTFRKDLLRTAVAMVPTIAAVVLAARASPPMDYY